MYKTVLPFLTHVELSESTSVPGLPSNDSWNHSFGASQRKVEVENLGMVRSIGCLKTGNIDEWISCWEHSNEPGDGRLKLNLPEIDHYHFILHKAGGFKLRTTWSDGVADVTVEKGDVLINSPGSGGCCVESLEDEHADSIQLLISKQLTHALLRSSGLVLPSNLILRDYYCRGDKVAQSFMSTIATHMENSAGNSLFSIMQGFLFYIFEGIGAKQPENSFALLSQSQLDTCFLMMQSQIELGLDVNGIARELGLKKSDFVKSFKKTVGKTPFQKFLSLRMEKAQILVREPKANLSSIAMELGFSDSAHFTKSFRNYWNMTPSKLRALQKKSNSMS